MALLAAAFDETPPPSGEPGHHGERQLHPMGDVLLRPRSHRICGWVAIESLTVSAVFRALGVLTIVTTCKMIHLKVTWFFVMLVNLKGLRGLCKI